MNIVFTGNYACLECRKTFRRTATLRLIPKKTEDGQPPKACPHCGELLSGIGLFLGVPRHDNLPRWKAIRFVSYGAAFGQEIGQQVWRRVGLPLTRKALRRPPEG